MESTQAEGWAYSMGQDYCPRHARERAAAFSREASTSRLSRNSHYATTNEKEQE